MLSISFISGIIFRLSFLKKIMKQENTLFQDYHGALYYISKNKDKMLTIFIVDDDIFYLKLLQKELSENSLFSIHTFSKGEDCLNYLSLSPNLIILDYHLDGQHSYAKNGAIIAKEINERLPNTETIIISSDHKLSFVDKLKETNTTVFFKDSFVYKKIETTFFSILKKRKEKWIQHAIFPSLVITTLIITLIIYLNISL